MYGEWDTYFRSNWDQFQPVLRDACGPFLIAPTEEYLRSSRRTLLVGQETNGWISVSNFLDPAMGVAEALRWYAEFNLAERHPAGRSPFWTFHRCIAQRLGISWREVLWTNLMRFDGTEMAAAKASLVDHPSLDLILRAQRGLLVHEIKSLTPHNVIFVTGPRYEHVLSEEIGSFTTESVAGFDTRELALIRSLALPGATVFRTYHPKFLRMSQRFDAILEALYDKCS